MYELGKCKKTNCIYIHDPSRISPCPQYLLGSCNDTQCRLSHSLNEFITPICSFFQKGKCFRSECRFLHIKHGNVFVCTTFADTGYCSKGSKCTEKHIFICPRYNRDGKCTLKNCKLKHQESKKGNPSIELEPQVLLEEGMIPMIPNFDQQDEDDHEHDSDDEQDEQDFDQDDLLFIESDSNHSSNEQEDGDLSDDSTSLSDFEDDQDE